MKRGILFFALLLATMSVSFAQIPDSVWTRHFGGNNHDVTNAIDQVAGGGFILAGWTQTSPAQWYDVWLVRADAGGDTLWTRTFGGVDGEGAFSVKQTSDGGFAIAGLTNSYGVGMSDGWLIKTDADGNLQWSQTYGGLFNDGFYAMTLTPEGDFLLAGFSESVFSDELKAKGRDFWLVKASHSDGAMLWQKLYGTYNAEECQTLCMTTDGGIVLAGSSDSVMTGLDYYLMKVNSNGDSLWTRRFSRRYNDICYSVLQAPDGGFLLAGSSQDSVYWGDGYNRMNNNIWIVKTNERGVQNRTTGWSKFYPAEIDSLGTRKAGYDEVCFNAQLLSDGGYILGGFTKPRVSENAEVLLVKIDPRGNTVYARQTGGSGADACYGLIALPGDASFMMCGYTESFGAQYEDALELKTSRDYLLNPPGPFASLTPADGDTFSASVYSMNFSWQRSANLDSMVGPVRYDTIRYNVYVSTDPAFADTAQIDTAARILATSFNWRWSARADTMPPITANQNVYWKIVAEDRGGMTSSTESRRFFMRGNPPSPFHLVSPVGGQVTINYVPLVWNKPTDTDSGDVVSYKIFMSRSARFDTVVMKIPATIVQDSLTASYRWTDSLARGASFYWYVQALDKHGLRQLSLDTGSFVINYAPPSGFDVVEPLDSVTVQNSPVFRWQGSLDSDPLDTVRYCIELGYDSLFQSQQTICNVSSNDRQRFKYDTTSHTWYYRWPNPLSAEHRYYWKVRAENKWGIRTMCTDTTRSFVFAVQPPQAFALIRQADSTHLIDSLQVSFAWQRAQDVDTTDRCNYWFYLADNPDFRSDGNVFADSVFRKDTITYAWRRPIVANLWYYWKVVALNRYGAGRSSEVRHFMVDAEYPSTFSLVEPTNESVIPPPTQPLLKWTRATDPDYRDTVRYAVTMSSDSLFHNSDAFTFEVGQDTSFRWTRRLVVGRQYWWQVRAYDLHVLSTYSQKWSFRREAGVRDPGELPTAYKVYQNSPNPFNATTIINYDLPQNVHVTAKIFDVLGRESAVLVDGMISAGRYRISFDASELPSGVYFLRFTAGEFKDMKKMVLIK